MAFQVFVDGNVLTAADVNDYLMEQANIVCTSATRPSSPAEGWEITETDTNLKLIHDGSGWVEMAGYGAWTSYTPSLTQSGDVTKTVTYARYRKLGRLVTVSMRLDVTGSGTSSNLITVGLPSFAPVGAADHPIGTGYIFDASSSSFNKGQVFIDTTTTVKMLNWGTSSVTPFYLGVSGFTAALASSDVVAMTFTYETTT